MRNMRLQSSAPWPASPSLNQMAPTSPARRFMIALVFVDTNVLIYALDSTEPKKQHAAKAWSSHLWNSQTGRVSFQVLQEFYAQVVRKWPSFRALARAEVRDLLAWGPVPVDAVLLQRSWDVQDRYQLSFWDALIVAAAWSASC